MNFVTVQEYKDYFNMGANPAEDTRIQLLIDSVSSLVQAYLKIDAAGGQNITETISVDYDTDKIFLSNYPINALSLVVSETGRITTDSTIHVPLTGSVDYTADATQGILYRNYTPGGFASWPISPIGYVTASYTTVPKWSGGMSGIPADLKLAVIQLVHYYFKEDYRQSKSIQGSSVVNNLASFDSDFPKHIQVLLDRYL